MCLYCWLRYWTGKDFWQKKCLSRDVKLNAVFYIQENLRVGWLICDLSMQSLIYRCIHIIIAVWNTSQFVLLIWDSCLVIRTDGLAAGGKKKDKYFCD